MIINEFIFLVFEQAGVKLKQIEDLHQGMPFAKLIDQFLGTNLQTESGSNMNLLLRVNELVDGLYHAKRIQVNQKINYQMITNRDEKEIHKFVRHVFNAVFLTQTQFCQDMLSNFSVVDKERIVKYLNGQLKQFDIPSDHQITDLIISFEQQVDEKSRDLENYKNLYNALFQASREKEQEAEQALETLNHDYQQLLEERDSFLNQVNVTSLQQAQNKFQQLMTDLRRQQQLNEELNASLDHTTEQLRRQREANRSQENRIEELKCQPIQVKTEIVMDPSQSKKIEELTKKLTKQEQYFKTHTEELERQFKQEELFLKSNISKAAQINNMQSEQIIFLEGKIETLKGQIVQIEEYRRDFEIESQKFEIMETLEDQGISSFEPTNQGQITTPKKLRAYSLLLENDESYHQTIGKNKTLGELPSDNFDSLIKQLNEKNKEILHLDKQKGLLIIELQNMSIKQSLNSQQLQHLQSKFVKELNRKEAEIRRLYSNQGDKQEIVLLRDVIRDQTQQILQLSQVVEGNGQYQLSRFNDYKEEYLFNKVVDRYNLILRQQ